MFTTYHSNQLEVLFGLLNHRLGESHANPFEPDIILVQSPGMAQWLQLQLAQQNGIATNLAFPMPASFLWQQYAQNLPNVSQHSPYQKEAMAWRLMRIIPQFLFQPNFSALAHYLQSSKQSEQEKLYQLAYKIADLFDQYLVYRPDWLHAWEQQNNDYIAQQISAKVRSKNAEFFAQLKQDIAWQAQLWLALQQDIEQQLGQNLAHRADLHQAYLQALSAGEVKNLPARLFIFGISALPKVYLDTFVALSQHIDVHCFFNNPCRYYWGDLVDQSYWQKLQIKARISQHDQSTTPLFSPQQLENLANQQFEQSAEQELLQLGNPLLASWGKQGRDFLYLLSELQGNEIDAFVQPASQTLLAQIQRSILNLQPSFPASLHWQEQDFSLSLHSCYSPMREVEALHDYLLHLFQQDQSLSPRDVVVMVSDIDKYQPYIQAVFAQYQQDPRYIPFSIADSRLSETDVLIAGFLNFFQLKQSQFSAEELLALLDIPAIRSAFGIALEDLEKLRFWVKEVAIRFGLEKGEQNYNAWQAGLERMLLGFAMREENGIWQDNLGFDASYGLQAQLVGQLSEFLQQLCQWQGFLQQAHNVASWHAQLNGLLNVFFAEDEQTSSTLLYIRQAIDEMQDLLQQVDFKEELEAEVVAQLLHEKLEQNQQNLKFLVGKVSFCTLLPMRAIPFRAVCLLGMNEADYPRQSQRNSFDLMQYHQQKGDRSRRNDDRYLFLEALLAAQDYFYISYVGRSLLDDHPQAPSVLVSQLLDYILDNLDLAPLPNESAEGFQQRVLALLVQQHGMRIFSPQNFQGAEPESEKNSAKKYRTFAKQWLPTWLKAQEIALPDFAQPLQHRQELPKEIELNELIKFVQHPVRFFFEKQLGAYFYQDESLIADSENFELNNLEEYGLKEQLVQKEKEAQQKWFAEQKLKGLLPRAEFAQIEMDKLQEKVADLQQKIAPYLSQPAQSHFVELELETSQGRVKLLGNLAHFYQQQAVYWRVGSLKDKNKIQYWLAYLLQVATGLSAQAPIFYSISGKNTETHSFAPLKADEAKAQLLTYVELYFKGFQQMQIMPNDELEKYAELCESADEQGENEMQKYQFLQKLGYKEMHYSDPIQDFYWQRLLSQSRHLNFAEIDQRFRDCFVLLQSSLTKLQ